MALRYVLSRDHIGARRQKLLVDIAEALEQAVPVVQQVQALTVSPADRSEAGAATNTTQVARPQALGGAGSPGLARFGGALALGALQHVRRDDRTEAVPALQRDRRVNLVWQHQLGAHGEHREKGDNRRERAEAGLGGAH